MRHMKLIQHKATQKNIQESTVNSDSRSPHKNIDTIERLLLEAAQYIHYAKE